MSKLRKIRIGDRHLTNFSTRLVSASRRRRRLSRAWWLGSSSKEMKHQGISKARLAKLMNTSRAKVDRILKAKGNVTIETLQRAAELVGGSCDLNWYSDSSP